MRCVYLLITASLLFLCQTCSLTSGLDEYDDYTFKNKGKADAGKDSGKPDVGDAGETWWQRYDRLSAEATPKCAEVAEKHLYCTGGVELEVDLNCPDHCHAVTGRHCFCPYKRIYKDAREICQSTDMHLVKIDDRDENEIIGGLMIDMGFSSDEKSFGPNGVYGATWIGLNDLDKEGTFVWPDGSEAGSFRPWANNQPDNLTGPDGEDCVAMHVTEDKVFPWYDYPCEIYEGMEIEKRSEAIHFFFCETKDAQKTIGKKSVAFISGNTNPCKPPEITLAVYGESCCTTVADTASFVAMEPGRCGMTVPGYGSMCVQFCKPGKWDYLSPCPTAIPFSGAMPLPPCCTMLGTDSGGYNCGTWNSNTGCTITSAATTTCSKPSAYKSEEERIKWHKCPDDDRFDDNECVLEFPEELAYAVQCCTEREDVEAFKATDQGLCGISYPDVGEIDCIQLNQKGDLDPTCPDFYPFSDSPNPIIASATMLSGCCTEFGVCGATFSTEGDRGNYGCAGFTNEVWEPDQLCRRADKDENIGIDPLLNEITRTYTNDAGQKDSWKKNYGNCDDPITYNNKIYYLCQGPLEWDQARAACEWKKDRYLVRIDDANENSFLRERFQDNPFWIGAYVKDMPSDMDFWYWSDKEDLFFKGFGYQCKSGPLSETYEEIPNSYVNWAGCDIFPDIPGQPNNDDGVEENCAQMRPDGFWSSEDCAIQMAYVCEEKG